MTFTSKKRAGRPRIVGLVATGALVLSACGGGGGSAADFCGVARSFVESSDEVDDLLDDMASPADLRRGLNEARSQLERLERAAPSEIRGDMTTIKNGFNEFVKALEAVDYNFFALFGNPEAMARLEVVESPDFIAAGQRVDDYTRANCDGLEIGFGDDGDDFDDFDFDFDFDVDDFDFDFGDLDDLDFGDLDDFDFGDLDDMGLGDLLPDGMDMSFLIPMYRDMLGITDAQATCLVERLADSMTEDPFSACGIDPSVFAD